MIGLGWQNSRSSLITASVSSLIQCTVGRWAGSQNEGPCLCGDYVNKGHSAEVKPIVARWLDTTWKFKNTEWGGDTRISF